MRKALIAVLAVSMLVFAGAAMAGKVGQAKPWIYNPTNIPNAAVATWTKDGLLLQKNVDTTVEVAAGAEFKGVAGETLTKLSFDVKEACTAGAPRFNITTATTTHFLGCSYGSTENLGDGWTRVTFDHDVVGATGAFNSVIKGAEVVLDEQGSTLLRNITVNDVSVNKF